MTGGQAEYEEFLRRERFEERYSIELSRYQLDNLRWVLDLAGYGKIPMVEPFGLLNTGDWMGELYWKLLAAAPDVENDTPNASNEVVGNWAKLWALQVKRAFDGQPK